MSVDSGTTWRDEQGGRVPHDHDPDAGVPGIPVGVDPQTKERDRMAAALERWWRDQSLDEVQAVVPKAVEYGGTGRAVDLIDIGKDLLRMGGVQEASITDEWATEAGIYFYLRGKVGRWTAAMMRGERVSDDTLHDISVYCRMAQRNRHVGGWPF